MTTEGKNPRRLSVREIGSGGWLKLLEVAYTDRHGNHRTWEAAARQKRLGAVIIIARLTPSADYLLVQQYRPPADAQVLEFPAGLMDPGETPEHTAIRELREETGYIGTIIRISQPCLSSPGMSGEKVCLAFMEIDESLPENQHPVTAWDDGEHMDILRVKPDNVPALLRERETAGVVLDSKVTAYFAGTGMNW